MVRRFASVRIPTLQLMLYDNFQLYETPRELADELARTGIDLFIEKYTNRTTIKALDPSAGSGALLDAVARCGVRERAAVEIHPDLVATLKGKGYLTFADDFLSWFPKEDYNFLIVNPPFADQTLHLLKAFRQIQDTYKGGVLAFICSTDTYYGDGRREALLRKMVGNAAYADIQDIGPAFANAARRTDVDITVGYLHILPTVNREPVLDNMEFEQDTDDYEIPSGDGVVRYNELAAIMDAGRRASEEIGRAWDNLQRVIEMYNGAFDGLSLNKALSDYDYNRIKPALKNAVNKAAWDKLLGILGLERVMSSTVKLEFDKMREEMTVLPITRKNVDMIVNSVMARQTDIWEKAVLSVFHDLTKYHEDNRVHIEGWKTNSEYMVGEKFILYIGSNYSGGFWLYDKTADRLNDIDKIMCRLTGKRFEGSLYKPDKTEDKKTRITTIAQAMSEIKRGDVTESTFFHIKTYLKGTVHFKVKAEYMDAWHNFNAEAFRIQGWAGLPKNVKTKKKKK